MTIRWKDIRRDWHRALRSFLRNRQERHFKTGRMVAARYQVERKLGMGSYGVAYLCADRQTGLPCVLKRVFPLSGSKYRTETLYGREVSILGRLRHPAIPGLMDHLHWRGQPCLIMEYVDGDNLDELLFRDNRRFTEQESLQLICLLLPIVEYLHRMGIVHRDISIGNVMLSGDRVRLIDFGLAVELNDTDPSASAGAAPDDTEDDDPMEKKLRRAANISSDLYAIGHLLLFLLYSIYEEKDSAHPGNEQGWETELQLHPLTRRMLRRLLQTDEPYAGIQDVQNAVREILAAITPQG